MESKFVIQLANALMNVCQRQKLYHFVVLTNVFNSFMATVKSYENDHYCFLNNKKRNTLLLDNCAWLRLP